GGQRRMGARRTRLQARLEQFGQLVVQGQRHPAARQTGLLDGVESLVQLLGRAGFDLAQALPHFQRRVRQSVFESAIHAPCSSKNAASAAPVCEAGVAWTCSVVPCTTSRPPPEPPSGPRSTIQSASAIRSRLCSITTTVCPASTSLCSTRISFSTSAMDRPTVGSSSTYSVWGAL